MREHEDRRRRVDTSTLRPNSTSSPEYCQRKVMPGTKQETTATACAVCGENANGNFFGALVCLPCKSFFIRCNKASESVLPTSCDCRRSIVKQGRSRCQKCRYIKCLEAGMVKKEKPESVKPRRGQILCHVCGDIANGIHFGIKTCEGCKKFFRRGLLEHNSYVCTKKQTCTINPRNRNNCRFCRYRKCVSSGMSRDAIKMGRPKKNGYQTEDDSNYRTFHPARRASQNEIKKEQKHSTSNNDSLSLVKDFVDHSVENSLTLQSLLTSSVSLHTDEVKPNETHSVQLALQSPSKTSDVPQIIVSGRNDELALQSPSKISDVPQIIVSGINDELALQSPSKTSDVPQIIVSGINDELALQSPSKTSDVPQIILSGSNDEYNTGCNALSYEHLQCDSLQKQKRISTLNYLDSILPHSSITPVPLSTKSTISMSSVSCSQHFMSLSPTKSSSLSPVPTSPASSALSSATSSLSPSSTSLSPIPESTKSPPTSTLPYLSTSLSPMPETSSPALSSLSPASSSLSPTSSISPTPASLSPQPRSLSPVSDSDPNFFEPSLTTTELENMLLFLTSEDVKGNGYFQGLQSANWNYKTVGNYFIKTLNSADVYTMASDHTLGAVPLNENLNMNSMPSTPNHVPNTTQNHSSATDGINENRNTNAPHCDVFSEVCVKTEGVHTCSYPNQNIISDNDRKNSNYMCMGVFTRSNETNVDYLSNIDVLNQKECPDMCYASKSSNIKQVPYA